MAFNRQAARRRRHGRIRKKIAGTAQCPRFCVTKSLKHLTVQLIDDDSGRTIVGLSTSSASMRDKAKYGNKEGAQLLGKLVAEKAKAEKIKQVVFDRGGSIYHGRVRALAEAAREAGLKF